MRACSLGVAAAWIGLCAASLSIARQSDPSATLAARTWSENYEFRVEVDGRLAPGARIFVGGGKGALMLLAEELGDVLMVQVNPREVRPLSRSFVTDGLAPTQVVIAEDAVPGPASPYTMEGDSVILYHQGRRVKLSRKPPILGAISQQDLLAQMPLYRTGMEAYAPAPQDVIYLKGYKYPVRLEIFFGSWCPSCKVMVPRMLKTLAESASPNIEVSFHGVPEPPFALYPPAKENHIEGVPTFIVYAEGHEIGRFSSVAGSSSVEHELVKILFAHQQSKG